MEKLKFPTFKVEGIEIPRVILGTNPFIGAAHFSGAKRLDYRRIFKDPKTIADLIVRSYDMGVNAVMAPLMDDKDGNNIITAIGTAQQETGNKLIILGTTHYLGKYISLGKLELLKNDAERLKSIGGQFLFLHGNQVDNLVRPITRTIEHAEESLAIIRDAGLIPGIGCHDRNAIAISDERGYDAAAYYLPLNKMNYYMPAAWEAMSAIMAVRNSKKPVFAIKPLACGRMPPREALEFVFSIPKLKGTAIGIASEAEMDETYAIAKEIIDLNPTLRISE